MMATHLGFYNTSSTRTHVRFQFTTHAAAGGNVAPNSAFEAADLRIYKATDGAAFSATQRSSSAGITMTSPFDTLTGVHDVDIDLTDNTDASFYAAGSLYSVVLAPDETVDGQTITGVVLAYFEIGVAKADVTQFGGTAGTFASGVPAVNATQISGDSTAADNLENAFDDTAGPVPWNGIVDQGTAQSASATGLVLRSAAAFADDTLIGMTLLAYGSTQGYWQSRVITANALSGDAVTVNTWTVTPSGTITYKILGSAPGSAAASDVNIVSISGDTTAADNMEAFFDGTGYAGTNNVIPTVTTTTNVGAASVRTAVGLASANLDTQLAKLDTIDDFLDTEIAAIKAKTDNLPSDPADESNLTALINAVDDFVDTEVAAIKTVVDAIKLKTDSLTFTQTGHVDANVQRINDVTITGDGSGTPFGV